MERVTTELQDTQDARLAAGGDLHAFERLYRRHAARVHSLARRMLGDEEADEATQDVFVRAWTKVGTFAGRAAFGTWLHRVAVNSLLGRRRDLALRRERTVADGAEDERPGSRRSPDLDLDFETAIGRLPVGAREIFVLHDVEGYRHREIAGQLGISSGTSKSQLHKARMMLREHLGSGRKVAP